MPGAEGSREWVTMANEHRVSFGDDENILELVKMIAQLCEYTKITDLIHFKKVNFIICELYLNKRKLNGFKYITYNTLMVNKLYMCVLKI